jgi:hypothetical protein
VCFFERLAPDKLLKKGSFSLIFPKMHCAVFWKTKKTDNQQVSGLLGKSGKHNGELNSL